MKSPYQAAHSDMKNGAILTHNGNGKYTNLRKPGSRVYSGRTMSNLVRAGAAQWAHDEEYKEIAVIAR